MPKGGFRAVRRFGFAVARVRLIRLTESRVGAKRKCPECHGNDVERDAPRGETGKAFFRLLVWIQRIRREGCVLYAAQIAEKWHAFLQNVTFSAYNPPMILREPSLSNDIVGADLFRGVGGITCGLRGAAKALHVRALGLVIGISVIRHFGAA